MVEKETILRGPMCKSMFWRFQDSLNLKKCQCNNFHHALEWCYGAFHLQWKLLMTTLIKTNSVLQLPSFRGKKNFSMPSVLHLLSFRKNLKLNIFWELWGSVLGEWCLLQYRERKKKGELVRNCMQSHRGYCEVKAHLLEDSHNLFFRWLIYDFAVCSLIL